MATPRVYIGRMFTREDGEAHANPPLVGSVADVVATQNMPVIVATLAHADQLRSGALAQASFTDMGLGQGISALQRATAATDDRGRS